MHESGFRGNWTTEDIVCISEVNDDNLPSLAALSFQVFADTNETVRLEREGLQKEDETSAQVHAMHSSDDDVGDTLGMISRRAGCRDSRAARARRK